MSKIISNINVDLTSKTTAFPYQTEAFISLKDMNYCAIFHEQGLGKTKIAIDLLLYWLQKRNIDTVMIVTKKQLIQNWINEFSIHTHIYPQILSNNKKDNFYVLNSPAKVIITNFETISTDKERIKLFLKCRDVAIIIDESTKLKNPNAKLTKDFFELSDLFKIRTIMTGTPVANRPYDIWAQIYFLDKGKSLGVDFENFKRNTDLSNNFSQNFESRKKFENSVASVYDRISGFSVRETKKSCSVELPKKIFKTVFTDYESNQYTMYKQVIQELCIEVNKNGEDILDDDSVSIKRLLRLLQISSNPRLIDDSYEYESGKEKKLDVLLDQINTKKEKCIVWSCFIENIELFMKKYKQYNPQKIHGSMGIEDRNNSVNKFKNDENCKILFATPQAAKEGLTLTVANHVVFYDRGFNLDDYLQAQDRIHRISQKKTCFVYNIMIRNSIDEWINKLLEAKQYAAFLAQGDIELSQYKRVADYTYGELIKQILFQEDGQYGNI